MPTVRFFTGLTPEMAERLTHHAPPDYTVTTHPTNLPDEEKMPLVSNADFVIIFGGGLSEPVLRTAKKLKLIQLNKEKLLKIFSLLLKKSKIILLLKNVLKNQELFLKIYSQID